MIGKYFKYQIGGTSSDEWLYQQWRESLPSNLEQETPGYDLRGAYESGQEMTPVYHPEEGRARFHLGSIGKDGLILKSADHDTFDKTMRAEIDMGSQIGMDARTGRLHARPKKIHGGQAPGGKSIVMHPGSRKRYGTEDEEEYRSGGEPETVHGGNLPEFEVQAYSPESEAKLTSAQKAFYDVYKDSEGNIDQSRRASFTHDIPIGGAQEIATEYNPTVMNTPSLPFRLLGREGLGLSGMNVRKDFPEDFRAHASPLFNRIHVPPSSFKESTPKVTADDVTTKKWRDNLVKLVGKESAKYRIKSIVDRKNRVIADKENTEKRKADERRLSNLIAETAHIEDDRTRNPFDYARGFLQRLPKESDPYLPYRQVGDDKVYHMPGHFEYETHTSPGSAESRILEKYSKKKYGGITDAYRRAGEEITPNPSGMLAYRGYEHGGTHVGNSGTSIPYKPTSQADWEYRTIMERDSANAYLSGEHNRIHVKPQLSDDFIKQNISANDPLFSNWEDREGLKELYEWIANRPDKERRIDFTFPSELEDTKTTGYTNTGVEFDSNKKLIPTTNKQIIENYQPYYGPLTPESIETWRGREGSIGTTWPAKYSEGITRTDPSPEQRRGGYKNIYTNTYDKPSDFELYTYKQPTQKILPYEPPPPPPRKPVSINARAATSARTDEKYAEANYGLGDRRTISKQEYDRIKSHFPGFEDGGSIYEHGGTVKPFVPTSPEQEAMRRAAYSDSLRLHNVHEDMFKQATNPTLHGKTSVDEIKNTRGGYGMLMPSTGERNYPPYIREVTPMLSGAPRPFADPINVPYFEPPKQKILPYTRPIRHEDIPMMTPRSGIKPTPSYGIKNVAGLQPQPEYNPEYKSRLTTKEQLEGTRTGEIIPRTRLKEHGGTHTGIPTQGLTSSQYELAAQRSPAGLNVQHMTPAQNKAWEQAQTEAAINRRATGQADPFYITPELAGMGLGKAAKMGMKGAQTFGRNVMYPKGTHAKSIPLKKELKYPEQDYAYLYRVQPKGFKDKTIEMIEAEKAKQLKERLRGRYSIDPKKRNIAKNIREQIKHDIERFGETTVGKPNELDKTYGMWFDKNPEGLDWYIKNRHDLKDNSEILKLKVPRKDVEKYSVKKSPAKWSSTSLDTEFVVTPEMKREAEIFNLSDLDMLKKEYKDRPKNIFRQYKDGGHVVANTPEELRAGTLPYPKGTSAELNFPDAPQPRTIVGGNEPLNLYTEDGFAGTVNPGEQVITPPTSQVREYPVARDGGEVNDVLRILNM